MLRTIFGDNARYRKQYWSEFKGNYLTGDGACRDRRRLFLIVGRIDDVLNVAGHRLGTSEIENARASATDESQKPRWSADAGRIKGSGRRRVCDSEKRS